MCTMNDNHDGRLLRYGVQRTEWSATDRIFCHFFLPFFALLPPNNQENQNEENTWRYQHFTNVYHKWQSYGIWFLRYGTRWTECFALLPLKNQNFENTKKTPGDIILQKCTKYHDHMLLSVLHPDIFWAYCFLKLRIG